MKSKLYQYAVILNPTDEKEDSKLIVDLKTTLAKSESAVQMIAIREIPKQYEDRFEEISVVVRPF